MAAASLGRLTLDLLVRLGSFEQGLNRAERQASQSASNMSDAFRGFGDQIRESLGGTQLGSLIGDVTTRLEGMQGSVLNATAGLVGMAVGGTALAIGGLTKLSIETAKADAEMAMLAMRAKVSIENFQIFSYAAEQLGISQDQLGSIFADVQEKLGEFSATGGGGAADFFDALKNNTKLTDDQIKAFSKTLQGKDGVEAVQMLKDKLDDLGASSQEQRFVFESLANDLTNLMPLFSEGGAKIEEYGKALQDAGVIKSKEAIQQSQILAAQTQAVNLQFQGAKSQLVQGFMPALVNVADAMFGTSKNGNQLRSVGDGLGTIFKSVAWVGIGLSAVIQGLGDGFGALAAMAVSAASGDIKGVVAIYKDSEVQFNRIVEDSSQRLEKLWAKTESGKTVTGTLTNAILQLNQAQNVATTGLKINTKEAEENAKAKEAQAKAIAKATKEQADLNKMVGASALSGLRIKSAESIAGGQVKAYTANFAQMAQKSLGSDLSRFTAFNDLYHKGTNSKHATGNAFDFTIADASKSTQAVKQLEDVAKRYGYVVKVLDEYRNPSSRATGGHLHVSVLGFKGTAEAAKQAQDELSLVTQTNEEAKRIQEESQRAQQSVIQNYLTEREKLEIEHTDKLLEIQKAFAGDDSAIKKYTDLQNAAYQKDVAEYQEAQKQKELSDKKQLLEVSRNWMTAGDYAREYYALVREEILNTAEYSPEMKNALVKQANIQQGVEQNAERESVWSDYQNMMGIEQSPYQQDIDLLAKAREQMLITEEEYQQQRLAMQLAYGSQYGADFAGMMMGLVDSSSSAYAVLAGIQKGAALFSTAMNSYTAISAAWASAPFPYNLPAVGIATMETGLLQAAVSALSPVGMAHNGIDSIPKEGTWLLDGGERVLNPNQNKDLTNYLSQAQSNSNSQQSTPQNLQINNILDPSIVGDFMGTSSGTKTFMNFIKNNRSSIKAVIG